MQPSDDASALHNLDVMSVGRRLNRPNNIRVVFADEDAGGTDDASPCMVINSIGGHDGGLPILQVLAHRLTPVCAEFDFSRNCPRVSPRAARPASAFLAACHWATARSGWLLGRRRIGIVLSEHTNKDGALLFAHACRIGLEGIVSKRLSAPYRSGRSRDWLKVKNPDSPAMIRAREAEW
jgi:hypothetical protein